MYVLAALNCLNAAAAPAAALTLGQVLEGEGGQLRLLREDAQARLPQHARQRRVRAPVRVQRGVQARLQVQERGEGRREREGKRSNNEGGRCKGRRS